MAFWNQKKKRKKLIRNLVTLLAVVTNLFIIAGVSRHWILKPRKMILVPPNYDFRNREIPKYPY